MNIRTRIDKNVLQYRLLITVLVGLVLIPASSFARIVIPGYYDSYTSPQFSIPSANSLPVLDQVMQNAQLEKVADNNLVIHQTDEKAIINWKSFDIGANAWTHFDQKGNTDWTALNRIYDENPSQIYGRLTGDGRVFLVNQNGILFGPGSQINTHSLVGSALNISDDDYLNGLFSFGIDDSFPENPNYAFEESCVSNHGTIEAEQGGWIFLLGPQVENSGTISAPLGQAGLAAGTAVELKFEQEISNYEDSSRVARLVNVKDGAGIVENMETGQIISDMGMAGMYGRIVNQNGLVRSVTAVEKDGNIELIASETTTLGKDSYTGCPVSDSSEKVHSSFEFQGGDIQIHAHDPENPVSQNALPTNRIEIYGKVEAPSGNVNLVASDRIYMETGSSLDVSGSIVGNSAQDTVIEAQLNSVEMADDYGQKDGILQGEYIAFTTQEGSSIGDVSAHVSSVEKTAGELSTEGGQIRLTCTDGDIILKEGATLDFSGGGIHYSSGYVETTKLVCGNKVYDISQAPQWLDYDRILGDYQKTYDRYGIVKEYNGIYLGGSAAPVKDYVGDFFQGDDAGLLTMIAPQIVMDGILDGSATAGVYQTQISDSEDEDDSSRIPLGGRLVLGNYFTRNDWTNPKLDHVIGQVVVKNTVEPLSELTSDSEVPNRLADDENLQYANGESVPVTLLGTDILEAAGLNTIEMNVNTVVSWEPDASLSLAPGGELQVWARQVNMDGRISIPSGEVIIRSHESFTAAELLDTSTAHNVGEKYENEKYVNLENCGIFLGENSVINVAGENIDNTHASIDSRTLQQGQLDGGTIILEDEIDDNFANQLLGLHISEGACLDVSGGFQMDPGGQLAGGNAGAIYLTAPVMEIDGDVYGYSLEDYQGGYLELFTQKLTIMDGDQISELEDPVTGMVVADDHFMNTGITDYTFKSREDLTVAQGSLLKPSAMKLENPYLLEASTDEGYNQGDAIEGGGGDRYHSSRLVSVDMDYLGDSSIRLSAGNNFRNVTSGLAEYSWVTVDPDAEVQVAPSGTIQLDATGIQMAGTLDAPGGSITLIAEALDTTVSYGEAGENFELVIEDTARILAQGCSIPEKTSTIDGMPVTQTLLDGGQVSFSASKGDITVKTGAVIDVSGSKTVKQQFLDAEGIIQERQVAGNPGEISFSFRDNLNLQSGAALKANGQMDDIQGGHLAIRKTDYSTGLLVASSNIVTAEVNPEEVDQSAEDQLYVLELEKFVTPEAGFDSVTLGGSHSIVFQGNQYLETGRKITLDTPLIKAEDGVQIQLTAPWITLTNSNLGNTVPSESGPEAGDAVFSATAEWIDLEGYIQLSGFGNSDNIGVSLNANRDIRLFDSFYNSVSSGLSGWNGHLGSAGNIELTAARIYPAMHSGIPSDFTFQTNGTISTRSSGTDLTDPIYSAGGSITLLADKIDHEGVLAAPMGQIIMAKSVKAETGDDGRTVIQPDELAERIYLAPGSRLTTKGEESVYYGTFDEEGIDWFYADKSEREQYPKTLLTDSPVNQISLNGEELILRPGSVVDVSGGGEIFSYLFLPGTEGTSNPLTTDGQYVILPDNRIQFPGESIYLEGVEGLTDGVYQLLPEEYAFLPGALMISQIGANVSQESNRFTDEGYQIGTGYKMIAGTEIKSPEVLDYTIRSASDVMLQGNFTTDSLVCGDGGDISIKGSTTIINGDIVGSALPADPVTGYEGGEGGVLSLIGRKVQIGTAADEVDIIFSHEVEEEYQDILSVGAETFNDSDLGEIMIGDAAITETITMFEGSSVTSSNVTFVAQDEILLKDGAKIDAVGSDDQSGVVQLTAGNRIEVEGIAQVHAKDEVILDTNELDLGSGSLELDNGRLTLRSDAICLGADAADIEGLSISADMWNQIIGAGTIELDSRSDIFFRGNVAVAVENDLRLDADRLIGKDGGQIQLTANNITLAGSENSIAADAIENTGTMNITANSQLTVENGELMMQGFSDILMQSNGNITFRGDGSLETNGGNLILSSRKIDTTYYQPEFDAGFESAVTDTIPSPDLREYIPANFRVDTGTGTLTVASTSADPVTADSAGATGTTPGGQLVLAGSSIEFGNLVDVPGGRVSLISGDGGIVLTDKAYIHAVGTDSAPGGAVELNAGSNGSIQVAAASVIDVSAGSQGDAGEVTLYAPGGSAVLEGALIAKAEGGIGGTFTLEAYEISELGDVTGQMNGFTESLDFRAHTGNLTIRQPITAESVRITADSGEITLASQIISDSGDGKAWVELNAGNNVILAPDSKIEAKGSGTDTDGGRVFVNSTEGDIEFQEGAEIDVSGSGNGMDGRIVFRALRSGSDNVQMNLAGTVTGASAVQAEAVAIHEDVVNITEGSINPDELNISDLKAETRTYMDSVAAGTTVQDLLASLTLRDRNGSTLTSEQENEVFNIIPGIEICYAGDGEMALENAWNFSGSSGWHFNDQGGTLTLRSAGDLIVLANLNDSPNVSASADDPMIGSWGIRLIAGADLSSSDLMSTTRGNGDLTIVSEVKVYTENSPLQFSTGGDTIVYGPKDAGGDPSVSMGTYTSDLRGTVGENLTLIGGVIQSATGNIDITVQENLDIFDGGQYIGLGAIRTIGQAPESYTFPEDYEQKQLEDIFWAYHSGGDIELDVGGNLNAGADLDGWDAMYPVTRYIGVTDTETIYFWSASYKGNAAAKGIAALAGGDLSLKCGGDFYGQVGNFGEGNLRIFSYGDMDGHFLVSDGTGQLSTMGSMGTLANVENQTIELMDARVSLDAQGHINMGTILNTTLAGVTSNQRLYNGEWDMTYSYEDITTGSENSAIYLHAYTGDVVLSGLTDYDIPGENQILGRILPPTVSIQAAGDIFLRNKFALAPSPTGNLMLAAGNNIYGQFGEGAYSRLYLPSIDPQLVYGVQDNNNTYIQSFSSEVRDIKGAFTDLMFTTTYRYTPDEPLHLNDTQPISITAGNDIVCLKLDSSKQAEIYAGNNIVDLYLHGQNASLDAITRIHAGNSIFYTTETFGELDKFKEIILGGPGLLWISAGDTIDLGATDGIQVVGNLENPNLPVEGADLIVTTGYDLNKLETEFRDFFAAIQTAGNEYSGKLAEGDGQAADQVVQELRDSVIEPFFATETSGDSDEVSAASLGSVSTDDQEGNLNMVRSQISTTGTNSDIFVISKGDVNVGRTTFSQDDSESRNTGIYTSGGGDIFAYARGDVNVNESRMMTFYDGDITVWSDYGNINAGRGSKTTVSATPAAAVKNDSGEYEVKFNPPAVGSGIRTLTFDPDGAAGAEEAPPMGDVFLFAPAGEIDAGEAGISGGNVVLGALSVVNVQNISFSQGAVGVPSSSEATATVGALTGGGAISEASKMADASAAIQAANKQFEQDAKAMEKTFMPTWLKVQFMGFDVEDEGWAEDDET